MISTKGRTLRILTCAVVVLWVPFFATRAAEKIVYNIKPGSASMSFEEGAIEANPAGGIQHAVILAEETLRDDTRMMGTELAHHFRAKILSNEGRSLANISIPYEPDSQKLKEWWGRTILPEGRVIVLDREELSVQSVLNSRGWDVTVLKAALPGVVPGSVIDYGYRITGNRIDPWTRVSLQREWPVRWFHYQWLPAEWFPSQYFIRRRPGLDLDVKHLEGSVLMQASNLPIFVNEPWMPPEDTVRASAILFYRAPQSNTDPDRFWDTIARKEEERIAAFIRRGKAIKKALDSMNIPGDAPLTEKLGIVYQWIESNIKSRYLRTAEESAEASEERASVNWRRKAYAAREQSTAEDLLARGEGWPGEIRNLLIGFARALGAEAHLVMAPDRRFNLWDRALLSQEQLDSRIVALSEPHAPDEKIIFADPGSGLPYGIIPWWVAPTTALRVTKEGGREILLPHSEARWNVLETGARIAFSEDDNARVAWWSKGAGQRGYRERLSLRWKEPEERRELLETLCGRSGDLEIIAAEAPALEGVTAPYRIDCGGLLVNVFLDEYEDQTLLGFNGPWIPSLPEFASAERAHPVVFSYPFVDLTTVEIEIPEGFAATGDIPGTKLESQFGSYSLEITETTDGYKIERAFALLALTVALDQYAELRGFLEKVRVADRKLLEITRPGEGM